MSKNIEELRQIVNKSENYGAFCELIKTVPIFRNNAEELFIYDKNTKDKICKLIKEIALKCVDLVEISENYFEKEIHKKSKIDALKLLEELDLPEEVKELARECFKN